MRALVPSLAFLANLLGGQGAAAREQPSAQQLSQALPGRPPAIVPESPVGTHAARDGVRTRDVAFRFLGSGTVVQARDGELIQDTESRHVELTKPVAPAATLASDLNSLIMSQELMNGVNQQLKDRVAWLRIRDSFFTRDSFYFNADRDDRTARPFGSGVTAEEEAALRRDMATLMQNYMIYGGLPKFFASRRETQPIAKVYNKAVGATSFSFKAAPTPETVYVWSYNMAVNPFQRVAEVSATNEKWRTGWRQNLRDPRDFIVWGGRALRLQGKNPLQLETEYHMLPKVVRPRVWRSFTPRLLGVVETTVPMAEINPWASTFTNVRMEYAF